jgi:hypothetical protein
VDSENNIELILLKKYIKYKDEEKIKTILSNFHQFDIAQAMIG